jgi:hypothetical protein
MRVAIAHAAPTAPAPIIPIFMTEPRWYPGVPVQACDAAQAVTGLATLFDLPQLATASALNNRQCVAGREGLPEGFVELIVVELPFCLHRRFQATGVCPDQTVPSRLTASHIH